MRCGFEVKSKNAKNAIEPGKLIEAQRRLGGFFEEAFVSHLPKKFAPDA
jgi:hypothetical protein